MNYNIKECNVLSKRIKKMLIVNIIFVLVSAGMLCQGAFGQNKTILTETVTTWVLSDFDDHEKATEVNKYNGGKHDIDWKVVGSMYVTHTDEKPYPQKAYLKGYPSILSQEYHREEEAMRLFAVRAAFNNKEVINTIDLIPLDNRNDYYFDQDGNPESGIFFMKPIFSIGLYALGLQRNYKLTATFEIENGDIFVVDIGSLDYRGWRVLNAQIPIYKYIDEEMFINNSYLIKLSKISIITAKGERVDDFVLFVDQIFYTLASVNSEYYDGYDISRADFKFNRVRVEEGKNNIEWQSEETTE